MWDLFFANRDAVAAEMTANVERQLKGRHEPALLTAAIWRNRPVGFSGRSNVIETTTAPGYTSAGADPINPSVELKNDSFFGRLSTYVANALRYWEPRRLVFNAVLALVVVAEFALAWPASRVKISFDVLLGLFILAVLANVAYCAAYAVDLFVQFSGLDKAWRRGRVGLLIVGTAFAATIAHFVAKGIFEP